MSFWNTIDYNGEEWRYVFVNSDPSLGNKIQVDIVRNIVDMSHHDEEEREISNEDYVARIRLEESRTFGMLCGKCFSAEIESEEGHSNLSILLSCKIPKDKLH